MVETVIPTHKSRTTRATWLLLGYAAVVLLPVLPFLGTLWDYAWYDTPQGYLIWIPLASFFSVVIGLRRHPLLQADLETDWIAALPFLSAATVLFAGGNSFWPLFFLPSQLPFLIWPLWAFGIGILFWGIDSVGALVFPSLYLALAWPGWYGFVGTYSQDVLVQWAGWGMHLLVPLIPAARYVSGATPLILIPSSRGTFGLSIGSSCSGSDALLGLWLFTLPFLPHMAGRWVKKLLLLVLLFPVALLVNLLRLVLVVLSARYLGPQLALDWVHPLAGPIVFLVTSGTLFSLVRWRRSTDPITSARRTRTRAMITVGGGALSALLFYIVGTGSYFARPVSVPSPNWKSFAVSVRGYRVSLNKRYNFQSIFGTGARDVVIRYVPPSGTSTWVNAITTPHGQAFLAYTFQDCFHFHNDQVVSSQLVLAPGLKVHLDRVFYPGDPHSWYVLYWQWPVKTAGQEQWQRVVIYHLTNRPPSDLVRFGRKWVAALTRGHTAGRIG